MNRCSSCKGTGRIPGHTCYACNGSGNWLFFFDCDSCGGSGYIPERTCFMCHGSGKVKRIQIPISKPPSISKPSYPDYSKLPPPPGHPWWNNRTGGGYGGADGNPNTPW
ncbi:MAG: hypothetical protein AB4206_11265 [Xenococcaceae cyanobacterium]